MSDDDRRRDPPGAGADITADTGGLLAVVTGPSGVGKDTVVDAVLERVADASHAVSATTRPPRAGERDGIDYHFVDRPTFETMARDGELLEWAEYAGHLYGTPLGPVRAAVGRGEIVILDIEVRGALQVRRRAPEALLLFLAPPSLEELERRLRARATETEEDLARRLDEARRELDRQAAFDHVVVNDDLDDCVAAVTDLLLAAR